jgi:hypothetical protein
VIVFTVLLFPASSESQLVYEYNNSRDGLSVAEHLAKQYCAEDVVLTAEGFERIVAPPISWLMDAKSGLATSWGYFYYSRAKDSTYSVFITRVIGETLKGHIFDEIRKENGVDTLTLDILNMRTAEHALSALRNTVDQKYFLSHDTVDIYQAVLSRRDANSAATWCFEYGTKRDTQRVCLDAITLVRMYDGADTVAAGILGVPVVEQSLKIWPNPVIGSGSGRIHVQMTYLDGLTLEILDMSGNVVRKMAVSEPVCKTTVLAVDMNARASGTYLLRIIGSDKRVLQGSVHFIK